MIRERRVHKPARELRSLLRARWSRRSPVHSPRRRLQPDRLPALDNARFLLIALVVVGHLLEQLVDAGPAAGALYRFIYVFHIPAFVLISGALSKTALSPRRVLRLAMALLLPYVLFQTLYPAWNALLFGTGKWSQGYGTPYWLLWYLPSLFCWRLLLPVFARLGRGAVPLATMVALGAGLVSWIGYPFSLSRTLVFFPLFMLGYRLGPGTLARLGGVRGRRFLTMVLLAATACGAWWLRGADPRWLYGSTGYAELGSTALAGMATRLALLATSAVCALAVIALVPRRAVWGEAGQRSLGVYLVHGFIVRAALAAGAFVMLNAALPDPAQTAVCAVAGIALAALLATRPVSRWCTPLLQPVPWLADRLEASRAGRTRRARMAKPNRVR